MTEFPSPANDTLTTGSEQGETPPSQFSRKRVLIPVATLLVGLLAGTVFTAVGATEFLIGDRYTAEELKIAKETSRKDGYQDGNSDGYEDGKSDGYEEGETYGYEEGKTDGYTSGYLFGVGVGECKIFDLAGDYVVAIAPPFNRLSVY
jgi:flagellar biosynthesis/type III secretory pathway protein FliH